MNTSPLGESGVPPAPDPGHTFSPAKDVRKNIGLVQDCLTRALDGLACEDENSIVWGYVHKQLGLACHHLEDAEVIAAAGVDLGDDDDDDAVDTPLVPQPPGTLPFPDAGPYEGRGS